MALAEVHHYEGTINQFLGDGFMALFGAPIAHEDDARRAVLAALGIQRRLHDRRVPSSDVLGEPGRERRACTSDANLAWWTWRRFGGAARTVRGGGASPGP